MESFSRWSSCVNVPVARDFGRVGPPCPPVSSVVADLRVRLSHREARCSSVGADLRVRPAHREARHPSAESSPRTHGSTRRLTPTRAARHSQTVVVLAGSHARQNRHRLEPMRLFPTGGGKERRGEQPQQRQVPHRSEAQNLLPHGSLTNDGRWRRVRDSSTPLRSGRNDKR